MGAKRLSIATPSALRGCGCAYVRVKGLSTSRVSAPRVGPSLRSRPTGVSHGPQEPSRNERQGAYPAREAPKRPHLAGRPQKAVHGPPEAKDARGPRDPLRSPATRHKIFFQIPETKNKIPTPPGGPKTPKSPKQKIKSPRRRGAAPHPHAPTSPDPGGDVRKTPTSAYMTNQSGPSGL